jgi:hypothetical protein
VEWLPGVLIIGLLVGGSLAFLIIDPFSARHTRDNLDSARAADMARVGDNMPHHNESPGGHAG